MAAWRGFGLPKPRHPCPRNAAAVLDCSVNPEHLAFSALIATNYMSAGRCSHPAQSYPQTLRVAVGLLLRILY